MPATDVLTLALGIPEGAEITWIERLRFAGDEPLALMHNAVPLEVTALRREDLRRRPSARVATAAEGRMLEESRGAPLLTMTRTAWDSSGKAVEYGSHIYPPAGIRSTLAGS